jgi:plastocyanin
MRLLFALAVLSPVAASLAAQGFVSRSPAMGGTWLPERRALQFNFIHRFYVSPAPARVVVNVPTFTWAVRLPGAFALGTRYSTHSAVLGVGNEIELFGRWRLKESPTRRLDVALTPAWNSAAHSLDGELAADYSKGRFTVELAARAMSNAYRSGQTRGALAGGLVFRINSFVAVSSDVASLLDRKSGEEMGWSAGLLFQIPNSPHFFNLHASNLDVNTIQGSSRRGLFPASVGKPLYGFEFTIPLHYKRFLPWFKPSTGVPPPRVEVIAAAKVDMQEFEFRSDTITVRVGQAVEFLNLDPVEHTVTFDAIATSSGLIPPKEKFVLRFDRVGTWKYHCTPHPFMQGVIIVR